MPSSKAQISTWSNNLLLEEIFHGYNLTPNIVFVKNREGHTSYHLFLIDLSSELSEVSQKVISTYQSCQDNNQKLVVALFHPYQIDTEKNLYFGQLLDKLGGENPLHRLVFVKDLFQADLPYAVTWLDQLVLESLKKHKITISSKGKNYFYPLTIHDLIKAILKIFFLTSTAGKSFWLVGDRLSDLEFAYLLKKTVEGSDEPTFEIDATGQNITFGLDLSAQGNTSRAALNWNPEEDFSTSLKTFLSHSENQETSFSELSHNHKLTSFRHLLEKALQKHQKGISFSFDNGPLLLRKITKIALSFILITYFCLALSFVGFTALSLTLLEGSINSLRSGDLPTSVRRLNQSIFYSQVGESSYSFLEPIISVVSVDTHARNYNLFAFEHYSQTSLGNLQQTYTLAEKILYSIGDSPTTLDYNDTSLALRSNLIQIYENLNQIDLLTGSGKLPSVVEKKIKANVEFNNLKQIEEQILQLTKIIDLIPTVLAGDSTKNIVVLFQNSQELRGTGGVIDFILTLSLEKGRVVSHRNYSSSEINTLASGLVEPPPIIKLYSGTDDWKLRDMNYNPDFPQTAENLSWFINRVLKFKPDVVLAVNDHLIQNLLDQDKNVADLEKELSVPNSSLYNQLVDLYINKLIQHKLSLLVIGRALAKEVGENQLLFWTADSSAEESILDQVYSGSVLPHLCHSGLRSTRLCLAQTTYLNQSNFSLSPVDHNLQRQTTHTVWLETNRVLHEYSIDYQFTKTVPDFGHPMINIVQLYAPTGSILDQVTLDGGPVPSSNFPKQTERSLDRFQIPISFAFNSNHHLSLRFSVPLSEPASLPIAYSLTEYRQPGLVGPGIKLQINYPDNARPAAITAPVTTGANHLIYNFPPRTSTFGVNFVPRSP